MADLNLSSMQYPFLSLSKSSKKVLTLICFFQTSARMRASMLSTVDIL